MEYRSWSVELNERPAGSLLVVGELLVISAQRVRGHQPQQAGLYAYELTDGGLSWSRSFEHVQVSGLVRTPSGVAQLLVAFDSTDWVSGQGMLLALNTHGEVQWRCSVGAQRVSAPVTDGSVVCMTVGTNALFIIDIETGTEQGKIELDVNASFAAPTLVNEVVYIPCRGPHLLAVGLDGHTRWQFDAKDASDEVWLHLTPILVRDRVIAVTSAGSVLALGIQDGSLVWQVNVGPQSKYLSPPVTDGKRVYVGASDGLYALDPKDGHELWTFSTNRRIEAVPVVVNGVVYVACHDHHIYALDAFSGKELWRHEVGGRRIELAPVVTNPGDRCGAFTLVVDQGGLLVAMPRPLSAEEYEACGHWGEAASAYADLGQVARAAQLLESHNESLKAAKLWEIAGEKERAALQYEAAQVWQQAAQLWKSLNQSIRRARALKQYATLLNESDEADISDKVAAWCVAAEAFDAEGEIEGLAVCRQAMAKLLQQPLITANVEHEGLILGKWTRVNFIVKNEGYGTAHHLIIRARGDQFEGEAATTREIVSLKAGGKRAEWLDIRPCQHGDSVPLRLSVEYQDDAGNAQTSHHTVHLPVTRTEAGSSESQNWHISTDWIFEVSEDIQTPESRSSIRGDMDYNRGFQVLKESLAGASTELQSELATLEERFWKNERAERIFGSSENTRSERSQVVFSLNEFALKHCSISFNDFCLDKRPTSRIQPMAAASDEALACLQRIEAKLDQAQAEDRQSVTQILDAIAYSRVEQVEAAQMVAELRSWAQSVQQTGASLNPDVRTAVGTLSQHTGSAYEYLQLAIPIIPGILSYNVELGTQHQIDLKTLWGRIKARLGKKGAKGDADPAAGVKQVLNTGKAWAVLVGVNQYTDSSIANLSVCVDDVTAVQKSLAGRYQLARLLTDATPDHLPTRSSILGELSAVAQVASEEDLLLFYFSGHGVARDGESYLLPCDTRVSALELTAVAMRDVRKIIEQSPAHAKVIILDACHSGASIGKSEPTMTPEFIRRVFEEAEGMAVLTSCKENQQSWEWPEQGRSVFTYYLLEALSGKADLDKKGFVTVSDANRYVTDGVKTWAADKGTPQTPTLQYTVAGDIILLRYQETTD